MTPRARLLKLFSGTLADQALLSAANLLIGIALLRYATAQDYGLYMLAFTAFLLAGSVLNALMTTPLAVLAPKKTPAQREALIAALHAGQIRVWGPCSALAVAAFLLAGLAGLLPWLEVGIGLVGSIGVLGLMQREFLRQVFLIHASPGLLLRTDLVFVVALLAGTLAALLLEHTALWMVLAMGLANVVAAAYAGRRSGIEPAGREAYLGALTEVWQLGRWSLGGCMLTWLSTQGWNYLLAALEGTGDLAVPNAARLLLMPVNLLLTGVAQMLLPQAARWYAEAGMASLLRRLAALMAALLGASAVYLGVLWLLRAWVIEDLLRQDLSAVQPMLLMWAGIFALITVRWIAMVAVQVLERFASLTQLAAVSTAVSLGIAWWAISQYGFIGSIWGIAAGETLSLAGILWLLFRNRRQHARPAS